MKKIKILVILGLTLTLLIIVVVTALAWHYPIDIHPYSFPNNINLKSNGKVPVAVLSVCDRPNDPPWPASAIDPSSVLFAGASPLKWSLQDVDGVCDLDLVLHFKTQELDLEVGDTEATLHGCTIYGECFDATDSVRVRD